MDTNYNAQIKLSVDFFNPPLFTFGVESLKACCRCSMKSFQLSYLYPYIEPESVRLDKSSYTVGESGIYYGFVNRSSNPPQLGMFLNNPLGAAALMANSSLLAMNRNGKVQALIQILAR